MMSAQKQESLANAKVTRDSIV